MLRPKPTMAGPKKGLRNRGRKKRRGFGSKEGEGAKIKNAQVLL